MPARPQLAWQRIQHVDNRAGARKWRPFRADHENLHRKFNVRCSAFNFKTASTLQRKFALHPIERFLAIAQTPFKLASLNCFENLAELWARPQTECNEIFSAHEWWRNNRLVREFFTFIEEKFVIVHHAMAARAIDTMQFQLLFKSRPRQLVQSSGLAAVGYSKRP